MEPSWSLCRAGRKSATSTNSCRTTLRFLQVMVTHGLLDFNAESLSQERYWQGTKILRGGGGGGKGEEGGGGTVPNATLPPSE